MRFETDCLDTERGLPKIIEEIKEGLRERFDLCITDPFYNESYDKKLSPSKKASIKGYESFKASKKHYEDGVDDMKTFSLKWLSLALEASKGVMFTCGTKHHYDWIGWRRPDYHEKYWHKPNAESYIKSEPLLFYGKVKGYSKIRQVIDVPLHPRSEIKTEHPTPKPYGLYDYLIKKTEPLSVLDCFSGSGTVGQACLMRNVAFLGIELGDYRNDWNDRVAFVSKVKGQSKITGYL